MNCVLGEKRASLLSPRIFLQTCEPGRRGQIRDVIVETKAAPVKVDFEVRVGIEVPRTVELRPLPPRIIEIVPAYRGYDFFVLADGRIVIVRPNTLEVVYIITA